MLYHVCTRVQVADGLGAAERAGSAGPALPAAVIPQARRQSGTSLSRMFGFVRLWQKGSDARTLFEPLEIPSIVMRHINESVEASPMVTPPKRLCFCLQPQTQIRCCRSVPCRAIEWRLRLVRL